MKYLPTEKHGAGHSGYQQQVKEANIKRIFDLVRGGKCKSRAEIVRFMNLSATSVSVLVEELAERGLIDETGPALTTLPGRRPISLRLNADAHQLAVFAIQPWGVRFTLFNLDCQVIESLFFQMETEGLTDDTAGEAYTSLFLDVLRHRSKRYDPGRALMIGVSFPGTYIECDHVFNTFFALGYSLKEDDIRSFQQRVGLPVYLLNTTRGMAYAEKKYLDAANADGAEINDLVFVQIQQSVHCALITGGDIFTGPYNVAGVIGHFTVDYKGRPCVCGNTGCLRQYVNVNAILEDAQQAARAAGIEPPETFEALVERYANEPALLSVVKQAAELLSFGLFNIMCSSGMRRIALGGGITALGKGFLDEVYRALRRRTLLIRTLDLSYAQAGPDAECVGLARYFLDKVYTITM